MAMWCFPLGMFCSCNLRCNWQLQYFPLGQRNILFSVSFWLFIILSKTFYQKYCGLCNKRFYNSLFYPQCMYVYVISATDILQFCTCTLFCKMHLSIVWIKPTDDIVSFKSQGVFFFFSKLLNLVLNLSKFL